MSSADTPAADTPASDKRNSTDLTARVATVIEVIRPAIQADDGDIKLHEVDADTGIVTVELMGACVSCPASTQTLKAGVERILKDRVDGITEVVQINADPMAEVGSDASTGRTTSPLVPSDGTAVSL
ncbi:MAG: NifU family protein [Acidimicrobiales bacterium]|nr:NifU family protein [Acidimicrobiales bacterium]